MTSFVHQALPIKLIALDLDGTLLTSQRLISDRNIQAVRRASLQGIQVALVSGRPLCALSGFIRQLNLDMPVISSGGAHIAFPAHGKVLAVKPLSHADIALTVRLARRAGVSIFIETENGITCENGAQYLEEERTDIFCPIIEVSNVLESVNGNTTKVALVGEPPALQKFYKLTAALHKRLHIVASSDRSIDVTRYGVNKGTALRQLTGELVIPLHQVLAVGDSPNDLSMFAVAGISVAMGNAPQEVRVFANFTAPTNDEDGVAWAIETLALGLATAVK